MMTELYEKLPDHMKLVWADTPWMINHWTDSIDSIRYEEIYEWLCDRHGSARCVVRNTPGIWMMGYSTVRGHTWIGFEDEGMMKEFQGVWNG